MLGVSLGLHIPSSVGGFSLKNVSGLQAWYKNKTDITLNGGHVSQWGDQSGNSNHLTQSTASNQPAYNSGNVHFDGSHDYMALDTALGLTNFTLFVVVELDNDTLETLLGNGSSSSDFFRLHGNTWTLRTAGSSYQGGLAKSLSTGEKTLITLYTEVGETSTRYYYEEDGTARANVQIDNQTFTVGDIGRNSSGAHFFDGKVSEIAIYNTELSQSDRVAVESDIMSRNGL